jgi:hypothetical protein
VARLLLAYVALIYVNLIRPLQAADAALTEEARRKLSGGGGDKANGL